MDQIILGTAGHIDHGKTSLIRALTGIETDRLKEEKKRGITIELGFASIPLESGEVVGIVDVPGHEKFVKNMVAGASGIDIVSMAIAADEGVMPQTREHMEICTLMGIKHGFIAMTKIDLVDEDLMELAMEDILEFTQGTFLEDAPIIQVSSTTGEGLEDFKKTLNELCHKIPPRTPSPIFRLPVDRVFSMKGFGTVITGTLASGKTNVGDNIMIFPSRITSKVRGIQVHGNSVDTVTAGSRTAINFQGLDRETIDRGDILSTPDTLHPSYMVDAEILFLSSNAKPAKPRTRVRFHSGTSEVFGYMVLLDRAELTPGDTACVQIRLETPVCLMKGDRFVIRSYSPIKTIGGGQILNPVARKHKLSDTQAIEGLACLMEEDHEAILSYFAEQGKFSGVSFADLRIMTSIPDKKLGNILQKMLANRRLIQTDKEQRIYVHGALFDTIAQEVIDRLGAYHKDNPLKEGMPSQELKSKFRAFNDKDSKLFPLVIARLTKENKVIQDKGTIRLSQHEVALQVDEKEVREKILKIYQKSGLTPPFFRTICQDLEVDQKVARDVLQMLIDEKSIVKTKDDLYFDAKAIKDIETKLVTFLQKSGEITTPQFKDMAGVSRKYIIPLIEYFDTINLTIRVGDTRQLRKKS
ncbi:selenocysteine-specific translation elongation factor SelB [Desulfocicer vacuolatum DSM 3385]|uniref:Selenocysteine-specific elongation factor n=1 Tax=Desulfocicer vacuolatum DSM 3385 TaxID=1121400 RepID=A0A1W2BNC7_9BACT|nr:selenocysteine-specific translation elongation factor [Desulfocicer vacuolatum]SMC74449.1 selenocysteine-specific translation elongation factor SelB [Desulfocicer vacuolatum DSM 3385]